MDRKQMEGMPCVSIIITNYNKQQYLRPCVESVVRQTYHPIEILIVDDCSTDDSRTCIESLEREFPQVLGVLLLENHGVSGARNEGIQRARGEYITTLDADDFYANENKIENEMRLLLENERKGIDNSIIFSNLIAVNEKGKFLWKYKTKNYFSGEQLRRCMLSGKRLHYPREYCFHKKWHDRIGGYNTSMSLYEDWDYLLRLSGYCDFYCTKEVGNAYRQTGKGLSAVDEDRVKTVLKGLRKKYTSSDPVPLRLSLFIMHELRDAGMWGKHQVRHMLIVCGIWKPKE